MRVRVRVRVRVTVRVRVRVRATRGRTLRTRPEYSGERYCATLSRSQCGRKPSAVEDVMTTVSLPSTSARWPWPISFWRSGLTPTTVRLSQRTSSFLVSASMVRKSPQRVVPHCARLAWLLW